MPTGTDDDVQVVRDYFAGGVAAEEKNDRKSLSNVTVLEPKSFS